MGISRESIVGKAKSKCKGPEVENLLFYLRNRKEAGNWSGKSSVSDGDSRKRWGQKNSSEQRKTDPLVLLGHWTNFALILGDTGIHQRVLSTRRVWCTLNFQNTLANMLMVAWITKGRSRKTEEAIVVTLVGNDCEWIGLWRWRCRWGEVIRLWIYLEVRDYRIYWQTGYDTWEREKSLGREDWLSVSQGFHKYDIWVLTGLKVELGHSHGASNKWKSGPIRMDRITIFLNSG